MNLQIVVVTEPRCFRAAVVVITGRTFTTFQQLTPVSNRSSTCCFDFCEILFNFFNAAWTFYMKLVMSIEMV